MATKIKVLLYVLPIPANIWNLIFESEQAKQWNVWMEKMHEDMMTDIWYTVST